METIQELINKHNALHERFEKADKFFEETSIEKISEKHIIAFKNLVKEFKTNCEKFENYYHSDFINKNLNFNQKITEIKGA